MSASRPARPGPCRAPAAVPAAAIFSAGASPGRGPRPRQLAATIMFSLGWSLWGGCTAAPQKAPPAADGTATRRSEQEDVVLTFSVKPAELEAPGIVEISIFTEANETTSLGGFDYGRVLADGDLRYELRVIDDISSAPWRTGNGGVAVSEKLRVEFVLPGDYELPAPTLTYWKNVDAERRDLDEAAPRQVHTLTTEPIAVVVRPGPAASLSEGELYQVDRLDPVELPTMWSRWWWAFGIGGVFAAAALAVLLVRRRRALGSASVPVPAHVWAQEQIAALLAADLLARGQVQEFYYRISAIVRGYIERRFGVSAPEMTTEEFLAAAKNDDRLTGDHTGELGRFLNACDLVKYARHSPGPQESDGVLRAACDFIERTRVRLTEDPAQARASPVREAAA